MLISGKFQLNPRTHNFTCCRREKQYSSDLLIVEWNNYLCTHLEIHQYTGVEMCWCSLSWKIACVLVTCNKNSGKLLTLDLAGVT